MAIEKLTALKIERARPHKAGKPRYLGDGAGLYLRVSPAGTKAWIYRYKTGGRTREMGLGPLHTVSLAEAREAALQCRKQRRNGVDPIDARRAVRQAACRAAPATAKTFQEFAEQYIASRRGQWNAKHAFQWESSLERFAFPRIGAFSLRAITKAHIIEVLEQPVAIDNEHNTAPLWNAHPETASRLRGRIEVVLEAAKGRDLRSGENPAAWRGNLEHVFAKRSKRDKQHFAALKTEEVPEFMRQLRSVDTVAAAALDFCIVTATRTNETRSARWSEFNLQTGLWVVPEARTKTAAELRIQLPAPARAILERLATVRDPHNPYVFSLGRNKPINESALRLVIRKMGYAPDRVTTHGFRSCFSTWAHDRGRYPSHLIEMSLGHVFGNEVSQAYNRSDLFAARARLMTDWAEFLAGEPEASAEVIALRA